MRHTAFISHRVRPRSKFTPRTNGLAQVSTGGAVLQVADPGWDGEAFVAVNPRDITLYLERPAASARNTFRGRIAELAPQLPDGERVRVAVASAPPLVAEVMRSTVESLGLAEGQDVYAGFKATGAVTYR